MGDHQRRPSTPLIQCVKPSKYGSLKNTLELELVPPDCEFEALATTLSHLIHYFTISDSTVFSATMNKLLHDGCTLIVDRYAYSGVVFSAAKKVSIHLYCT